VAHNFKLRPGRNLLEVVAVNRDAAAGQQDLETDRLSLEVTLKEKARPPLIALTGVLPAGAKEEQSLPVQPGEPVRVSTAGVRLVGNIGADQALTKAEWLKDGAARATPIEGFEPNKKELKIGQDVELTPGEQRFRLRAMAGNSDEAETVVTLFYEPPVPAARLTAPQEGEVRRGEQETEEVVVRARLDLPRPLHPYRAAVLVDGKEPATPPRLDIDEKAGTLSCRVALHPGANRIQVRFANEWGAVWTSEAVELRYLRPPVVAGLNAPRETKEPFVDLEARVRSSLALLPQSVRVEVNGQERQVEAAVQQAEPGTWAVRVKGVPLDASPKEGEAGRNEIQLAVENADGPCPALGTTVVLYRPLKPPPTITVLLPRDDITVHQPTQSVKFRVSSTSPLRKVVLIREGGEPVAADVSALRPDASGQFELTAELEARLGRDLNTLRIVATNDGGEATSPPLHVTYPDRPVRVLLDSLAVPAAGGEEVRPQELASGQVRFPAAPAARVRLRGRVVWDETDDDQLRKAARVRIYVNGFQQLPRALGAAPTGRRERPFEADLTLSQEKDNQVDIALPDLQVDGGARTHFALDCLQPARQQRLHLLLISLDDEDPQPLKKQFLDSLGATGAEDRLETRAFSRVNLYGPQVGLLAGRPYLNRQLLRIQSRIRELAGAGISSTDVVVIYYRGKEAVNAEGNYFQTSQDATDAEAPGLALSADELADFFADTPGADMLLLDVDRPGRPDPTRTVADKVARWDASYPRSSRNVAVLRYAWLGRLDAPANVRLISVLRDALRNAALLINVTDYTRRFANDSAERTPALKYNQFVAEDVLQIKVK
jgi:hypothetical protein